MSNGSESTPERCVHAVDGPDWAGLRELNNADVDYKALVEHSRQLANFDDVLETKGVSNTLGSLADAIEALVAENEKLREERDEFRRLFGECHPVHLDGVLKARRLQARLDAMIVEWGHQFDSDGVVFHDRNERDARGQVRLGRDGIMHPSVLVQRLVGPWTVVPEGDAR